MVASPPRKLYKYRGFTINTLRMLSEAEVYFASPTLFNDPLDCRPTIDIDVEVGTLQRLLAKMLEAQSPLERAKQEIANHWYMATEVGDPEKDDAARRYHTRRLASNILDLLTREYSRHGVLSLAARWNCPLMWSHYADQHRGLCIEYSVHDAAFEDLRPVQYNRSRTIKASTLVAWKLERSNAARLTIEETIFLAKAPQWRYEKEWRAISSRAGPTPAIARVTGIYFGLRCDTSVVRTLVLAHPKQSSSVHFYALHIQDPGFRLIRRRVDADEIHASGVASPVLLDFRDVIAQAPDA